jgi:hypothetical protein
MSDDDFAAEVECCLAMYPEAAHQPPAVLLPFSGAPGVFATVEVRPRGAAAPLGVELLRSRGVSDASLLAALTSHAASCATAGEPALLSLAALLASLLASAPQECGICLEAGGCGEGALACPCSHAFHGPCLSRYVHGVAERLLAAPARAGADAAASARAAEARAAREGAARAADAARATAVDAVAREGDVSARLAVAEAAAEGGAAAARGGGRGAARAAAAAKAAAEEAAALRAELETAAANTARLCARAEELRERAEAAATGGCCCGGGGAPAAASAPVGDPLCAHVAAVHCTDGHPVPLVIPCPTCRAPLPPHFLRGLYTEAAARAARAAEAAAPAGGGGGGSGGGGSGGGGGAPLGEAPPLDAATSNYLRRLKRDFTTRWKRQQARGGIIT